MTDILITDSYDIDNCILLMTIDAHRRRRAARRFLYDDMPYDRRSTEYTSSGQRARSPSLRSAPAVQAYGAHRRYRHLRSCRVGNGRY